MVERCPSCGAVNARVRSEVDAKGWLLADDYCGRCGHNWPRPAERPASQKVTSIEDHR